MSRGYMLKCAWKRQHPDQASAEKHRKRLVWERVYTMAGSNTYECNVCGFWHVGRATGNRHGRAVKGKGKGKK